MVLLAQHRAGGARAAAHEAHQLLERLLVAAEAGGRAGNVLEVLVQMALASEAQGGNQARATDLLRRALVLAEGEGHIRVFLDAGPHLTAVLRRVEPGSPGGQLAREVLAAGAAHPPRPRGSERACACSHTARLGRPAQRARTRHPAPARQ